MTKVKIIFSRSKSAVGLLIRFFDICPYSHVGIVSGDWVYESLGSRFKGRIGRRKGVVKTPLSVFKKRCSAWQEKEIDCHNDNWLADFEDMVARKVEYDIHATVGSLWLIRLFRIKLGCKHRLNCSELVNVITKRFIEKYNPTVSDFWRLAR